MGFIKQLEQSCREKNSLLSIGLDPRVPEGTADIVDYIVSVNRDLIAKTADYAAAYKPNSAFYEAWGPEGLKALKETIGLIPSGCPVILDVKRNDIGATAEAYAKACFDYYGADAVTLNPYMGRDAADPFLAYKGRGIFVLTRTSNRSAGMIQDLIYEEAALYVRIARSCAEWGEDTGLVVAGNDTEALAAIRKQLPNIWFLSPGIGVQGGSMREAVSAGIRADGSGILPHVGRAISAADDPGRKAREYRDAINQAREQGSPGDETDRRTVSSAAGGRHTGYSAHSGLKSAFLSALLELGCFKTGDFVLKSGKKSPFYIDLRRLISDAAALRMAGKAYASLSTGLDFDRVAGIPLAALPLSTAFALESAAPMIYPRMPVKKHGTGNRIEGHFEKGDRVLLLDDLISAGTSKLEAVDLLREEGLVVEDLLVLIKRGGTAASDMQKAGIKLHAFADVRELFSLCRKRGIITVDEEQNMINYIKSPV